MLKPITPDLIDGIRNQAQISPRKRANYRFHQYQEPVQRMVNIFLKGSYGPPHKHESPDKVEIFMALEGRGAVFAFDDSGGVADSYVIDSNGPIKVCEIPPRVWHTVIALSPVAVFYEIIQGPYNEKTHKKFAPWAPSEEQAEKAQQYLKKLESLIP